MVIMLGYTPVYAQDKVTCKASIVFHGQELSGRMMFKQISEDTIRFAFFNELGMSFVEGSLSVSGQRSAVSGQRSAVSGQVEIQRISDFLDHKSFIRNFEKGLIELIIDKETDDIFLPAVSNELVFRRGNKFIIKLDF
jgi:hypothetical protein